ncbi:MAG TPA: protein kinase [Anaerolineales bacterium]|nr:protein kinase [Anaerolineales bacterium]
MAENTLLNNRYQLETRLGSGGMAVVYRAKDLMLERTVAVKVLREDYSNDPAFRERFRQEAKAAANLSHPSIVTVHDFGLDAGKLFIVMEYVPGADLKTMLQTRGRFSVEEALPLLIQACAGIGYAHRAGLVHCDVKPQNMLVTPDQRLKVTDFGIARALGSINPNEQSKVVWGSPQYFSPEQATGAAPSPASDVYALGVVMYEMLCGRLPFTGNTAAELAQMHRSVPTPPPSHFNANIPPALEQIILKVLSKEPSARYRTADQLGRVLMTFNRATTVSPVVEAAQPPAAAATANSSASYSAPPKPQPRPAPPVSAAPPAPAAPLQAPAPQPAAGIRQEDPLDIDWGTWALGLLAAVAVLGLVPLWTWVILLYSR